MSIGQARAKREAAEHARRLAQQLSHTDHRARILTYADELDAQAAALEQALPLPPDKPTD